MLEHSIVHVLKPITIKEGYNLHVLNDNETFKVKQGDTIGWISDGGGKIAHLTAENKTYQIQGLKSTEVKVGLNISWIDTAKSTQLVNVQYMASLISAVPARFAFKYAPYSTPGIYTAHAKFISSGTETTATSSAVIHVQKPLTFLIPNYPDGFRMFGVLLNRSTEVSVNISATTNVTISWYQMAEGGKKLLRQQILTDFQSKDKMNISFSSKGTHDVYVEAVNNVSSINTTISVKILETVSGLTAGLAVPNMTVYKGIIVRVNASVATGSDVRYKWIFDGIETGFVEAYEDYFRRCGKANVTVIATNLVSELRASFTVLVYNPISIESPAWGAVNFPTNFKCSLVSHSSIEHVVSRSYAWRFGDGYNKTITGQENITHTFVKAGYYNISCSYKHHSFLMTANKEILILEPVISVRIKNVSAVELYDKKTYKAVTVSGNNLTYKWYIYSNNNTLMKSHVSGHNTIEHQFNITGLYRIKVNVSNPMSWKLDIADFQVQERISGLNMTSYPNPAPSNSTITFNITKGTGSNVSYRLDFGDGFVTESFSDPFVFQRTFLSGTWQVILRGM